MLGWGPVRRPGDDDLRGGQALALPAADASLTGICRWLRGLYGGSEQTPLPSLGTQQSNPCQLTDHYWDKMMDIEKEKNTRRVQRAVSYCTLKHISKRIF